MKASSARSRSSGRPGPWSSMVKPDAAFGARSSRSWIAPAARIARGIVDEVDQAMVKQLRIGPDQRQVRGKSTVTS